MLRMHRKSIVSVLRGSLSWDGKVEYSQAIAIQCGKCYDRGKPRGL